MTRRTVPLLVTLFFLLLASAPLGGAISAHAQTLRMATSTAPSSLDPQDSLSGVNLTNAHNIFDPLVRWTDTMALEPRLAERWERLDPYTVRFYLRPGVTFHSGNHCTAQDVQWTVDRLRRTDDYKGMYEPIEAVDVVDEYTIDFRTKRPYPLLLNLAAYVFVMDSKFYTGTDQATSKPKDLVSDTEMTFAKLNASGTGPFVVSEFQQGTLIELKRFPGYWDRRSPGNVDRIVHTAQPDDAKRTLELLAGKQDLIYPVNYKDYARLSSAPGIHIASRPGTRLIGLFLDQERQPAFRDVRVRRAMMLGINNWAIADSLLQGGGLAAAQFSPPGFAGHDPELTPRFDPERARELLALAGYAEGFDCTMIAPNNRYLGDEEIAGEFVRRMKKLNIRVKLATLPISEYGRAYLKHTADIQMLGWLPDTMDTANYFETLLLCRDKTLGYGRFNSGNYCNRELDETVLRAGDEIDMRVRASLLRHAERIAHDDAAFLPLHWENLTWAMRSGMTPESLFNPMGRHYLADVVMP